MGGGGASGRFVRNHADESGFYEVSEIFPTLTAEPQRWLDEAFLKIEKIKSITVSPPAKPTDVAWKVTRADEVAEFTLEGAKEGEVLDTTATSPLKSLFSYARFDDVVSTDTVDKIAKPLEKRTVKIETLEGFVYTLTVTPTEAEKPKENDPESRPAGRELPHHRRGRRRDPCRAQEGGEGDRGRRQGQGQGLRRPQGRAREEARRPRRPSPAAPSRSAATSWKPCSRIAPP